MKWGAKQWGWEGLGIMAPLPAHGTGMFPSADVGSEALLMAVPHLGSLSASSLGFFSTVSSAFLFKNQNVT